MKVGILFGQQPSSVDKSLIVSPQVVMEVHPLLHQLDSLLAGEEVRGRLSPGAGGGISPGMRDGSSHVLRCLKVWYDLPSDVFHTAVSNIVTFLAKMKVKIHHLLCLLVAAIFALALAFSASCLLARASA